MKIVRNITVASLGFLAFTAVHAQTVQNWMSPEVGNAWSQGYKGAGVTVTVIDDFKSSKYYIGKLGGYTQIDLHGNFTKQEASLIAPLATLRTQDYYAGTAVGLNPGLNVLNLSYSMIARAGYAITQIGWNNQESSIIGHAKNGRAVVAKAAGNAGVVIGTPNAAGNVDYLGVALKGAASAIFVGALTTHGSTAAPASLASYSNRPGNDAVLQRQFLTVGVLGDKTGLNGTSFGAPIISGYSAILGSKFTQSTPTQIVNQLLNTARKDTIAGYNAATHGRGEASLTRALAPVSIQ